ncbi:MAG: 4-hydroxy-tetrahydrodipicolinate reductase [Pedobacter sp.]|nr:MAG: 4-hydroxy-tetrahydrodipicolinate reductase [Pedobacter sp.]
MKIALLGYGKMGQIIAEYAIQRGHAIELKINKENRSSLTAENLKNADIAIDFSTPEAVIENIQLCFQARVPIVVGTTGWYGHLQEVKNQCLESNNSLLYGSNFSIGVNLFFHMNKIVANLMNNYPAYDVQVEEIHHTKKLDSPSGTAITIAEDILDEINSKSAWINRLDNQLLNPIPEANKLIIDSFRVDQVPGTHVVRYTSEIDDIELKHTAHNRNGFALGAVVAAEWLKERNGFYQVKDMFSFT